MTVYDTLMILNEKINKARREKNEPYIITVQDEIDIHLTLIAAKTKIRKSDGAFNCDVTECCCVGPITNEQYCPMCGRKIIRKENK